jgi:hypothetical protein
MATRGKSRSKTGKRRYGPAASRSVESAMRRRKRGTLKSGKGGKGGRVRSRKQAIAIGLSEARKKGAKVPSRRRRAPASRRAGSSTRSKSRSRGAR